MPDSSEEAKVVKSKKKESGSEDKKSDGTADETAKSEVIKTVSVLFISNLSIDRISWVD